jgi:DNA segregation ATPase FtsK/SpoIIIE, S-DNA-T family
MLEDRNPKRDVFALVLLGACVFLALALRTYHPTDPPTQSYWPESPMVQNACGKIGAYSAHYLFQQFGYGAYFLLITLVVVDLMLLARRVIPELGIRTLGWVLALAGISTLAALIAPVWDGPAIGPGGYLGASGRAWLETHFAATGSYVLTISMIFAGLLLCTDYVILNIAGWMFGTPARGLAIAGRKAIALAPRRIHRPATDVDGLGPHTDIIPINSTKAKAAAATKLTEELVEEETPDGPKLKFRGKVVSSSDDDDEEDDDDEDEDEDDDLEDEDEDEDDAPTLKLPGAASATTSVAAASTTEKPGSNVRVRNSQSKKDERENLIAQIEAASRQEDKAEYELPSLELLLANEAVHSEEQEKEVRLKAKQIEKTFADFGFNVKVVEIETGPVIAQYEVELEAGLRLSKITGLADDLAIALRVPSVRIVAPIPGKNTVGIEVPNNERQLVRLREVIEETSQKSKKFKIPIFLGKDVAGNPMTVDLAAMPHLLIAGRTGTGKSVCLNSIIVSMLMTRKPDEVRMLMIDPKMVELSPYKTLPHLMHPVVTDMRKAEAILAWAVEKMEERYSLLARAGVRHITVFNQLGEEELRDRLRPENDEEWASIPKSLPFIVIIADEMADLMMTSGKEVEQHIIRLAQKSRAVGIHLILATQKPTVDVITGLIKSNLPARIAFQVASRTDSRVVLDENGADKLLGNGDMLFLSPGTSTLLRGQGTYLSDEEINKVVEFVSTTEPDFIKELVQLKTKDQDGDQRERIKSRDDLYESAVEVVIREKRGSVSLLQRSLGIGYGRAARMIDYMAEDGIVGEYNGSNAREVLLDMEQWQALIGEGEAPPAVEVTTSRKNRIVPERDPEQENREPRAPKSKRSAAAPNVSHGEPTVRTMRAPAPTSIPMSPSSPTPTAQRQPMTDGTGALSLQPGMEMAPWETTQQVAKLYEDEQEESNTWDEAELLNTSTDAQPEDEVGQDIVNESAIDNMEQSEDEESWADDDDEELDDDEDDDEDDEDDWEDEEDDE